MRPRIPRTAAEAVEFALILPIMLVMVFGTIDYAWYLACQMSTLSAAREGARAGAATPQLHDPEYEAYVAAQRALDEVGLSDAVVEVDLRGAAPMQVISVTVSADYDPIIGFVPTPDQIGALTTMRMEDQPD